MSIKDLFNNPGAKKIQKSVTSDEMVQNVESQEYIEAKKTEFEQFVPPIDFLTASNFAKFGSAELYYEKAFETKSIGFTFRCRFCNPNPFIRRPNDQVQSVSGSIFSNCPGRVGPVLQPKGNVPEFVGPRRRKIYWGYWDVRNH